MATRQTSKQNEPACARHGLSAGGRWIRRSVSARYGGEFVGCHPGRSRRNSERNQVSVRVPAAAETAGSTRGEFAATGTVVRILLPPVESCANSGSEMGSASTAPCGCCDARQGSMWVAVGHKRVSPIYNLVARGDAAARSLKRGSPPAGTLCDPPVGAHCFKSRALAKPVAGPVPSRPSFVTTVGED